MKNFTLLFPNFLSILCERLPKLHDLGSSAHFPKASNSKFHRDFRNCFYAECFFINFAFSSSPFVLEGILFARAVSAESVPGLWKTLENYDPKSSPLSSDFSTTYGKTAPGIPRSVESVAQKSRTLSELKSYKADN